MTEPPIVLAVYGTLRRGEQNEPMMASATFLGTGLIDGRLFEMARTVDRAYGYPSLVDGPGKVRVELYALTDAAMLAEIDALESFDPADEAGSEYVRRSVEVRGGPVVRAWAYVYNGPREAMGIEIRHGDWVAHRRSSS